MGPTGMKQLAAVLPDQIPLFAVGGVNAQSMNEWAEAGAKGAGLGSPIYRAGDSPEEAGRKARAMVEACRATFGPNP
jgi:2-dehydro-3-deoxyphosphogalactonate aldolase